jgi:excisionase family DNA binding protein
MRTRRGQTGHPASGDRVVVDPDRPGCEPVTTLPDWINEFADADGRCAAPEPTGAELAPAFLTVREKAARLRVCEKTVRRLINRGELPCVKVGRQYRLPA